MTESPSPAGAPRFPSRPQPRPQHIPVLAGMIGALLGGGAWALIAGLTDREVGYVAWGVGLLTGFVMTRASEARGRGPAMAAAAFAAMGLLFGKVWLHQFVVRPTIEQSIVADTGAGAAAGAWRLRELSAFPVDVQASVDSVAQGDTLSDALWLRMTGAGRQYMDSLPAAEREPIVREYAATLMAGIPFVIQMGWHFSAFDILWFFLALTTAWRMLSVSDRPEESAAG